MASDGMDKINEIIKRPGLTGSQSFTTPQTTSPQEQGAFTKRVESTANNVSGMRIPNPDPPPKEKKDNGFAELADEAEKNYKRARSDEGRAGAEVQSLEMKKRDLEDQLEIAERVHQLRVTARAPDTGWREVHDLKQKIQEIEAKIAEARERHAAARDYTQQRFQERSNLLAMKDFMDKGGASPIFPFLS